MKQLGQSELQIPSIIFGAWAIGGWYWGGTNDTQSIRAIHASIDAGISAFDTAPVYGFGHSETILGKALRGKRQQSIICTKIGLRWDSTEGELFFDVPKEETTDGVAKEIYRNLRPKSIRTEVEQSLTRLQTDYIDLLQCHWPDPSFPIEETMKELIALHQEGKIRAIGVSNFDTDLLSRSLCALSPIPLASTQPRYSLLNRSIETEIIPWLLAHDVGAMVYSPIEQGLLAGTITAERTFSETDGRSYDPLFSIENRIAIQKALQEIDNICHNYKCSYAQLCAAWCIHRPGITAAIVGARTPEQALTNAYTAQISLSPETVDFLSHHFQTLSCCTRS